MDKNRIKRFLDGIIIVLLVFIIVLFNLEQNIFTIIGQIILTIITILIAIVDRIYWRCPQCNRYLPQNSFFHYVLCCPYCGTNIEMNKKKRK